MDAEIKTIENKRIVVIKKEVRCRKITNNDSWMLTDDDYESDKQLSILKIKNKEDNIYTLMCSEIRKKISGYKSQDIKKDKYNEIKFINEELITNKLLESDFNCYYCRCDVVVLYKEVRAHNQWSVERLNNDFGHNTDNVVIACLSCNLKRKTMYHERYRFTKQVKIVKK
jgi:hypothetical protein